MQWTNFVLFIFIHCWWPTEFQKHQIRVLFHAHDAPVWAYIVLLQLTQCHEIVLRARLISSGQVCFARKRSLEEKWPCRFHFCEHSDHACMKCEFFKTTTVMGNPQNLTIDVKKVTGCCRETKHSEKAKFCTTYDLHLFSKPKSGKLRIHNCKALWNRHDFENPRSRISCTQNLRH